MPDLKANGCEIVFTIFARTTTDEQKWQLIFHDLLQAIRSEYKPNRPLQTLQHRSLAQDASGHTRVSGATISLPHPLSLQACTLLTHTPALQTLQTTHAISLIIQPRSLHSLHRTHPGLAVFDMDSTLIQQEVIDELARAVGRYDRVAAITEAAMRGEAPYTDFSASLRARVALLKGVPVSIWDELKRDVITFTPGARELTRALRQLGWKTAVLSGGFTPLAEWVKETLGLDYAVANFLVADEERGGVLTGELVAGRPIIDGQAKRELLVQLAAENGVPIERTIAVGDGSNDLLMMGVAGLGIAFNAKPKVQAAAPARLNGESLLDVLYVLGYSQAEIRKLQQAA